jgi:hypothetical protein
MSPLDVTGWLEKSRRRRSKLIPGVIPGQLIQPRWMLTIGLLTVPLFALLGTTAVFMPKQSAIDWVRCVFVWGIAATSLFTIARYYLARHRVSAQGLDFGHATGARTQILWSDLQRVEYCFSRPHFRLQTHSGNVVRIWVLYTGLPEFATLLLAHTASSAIDNRTLAVLQATARGNPPEM